MDRKAKRTEREREVDQGNAGEVFFGKILISWSNVKWHFRA
jgi:hypothetical protein